MIISLDCETTGIDVVHGAMPFLVTTCDDTGVIRFWEWNVDPETRYPEVMTDDIAYITELIDAADLIYLQNAKFDYRALLTIWIKLPWEKVRDTLVMGHLLASNYPHDLTSMCKAYLGVDIEPLEIAIKEVTRTCRGIVKKEYPEWKIADEGVDGMPSIKSSSKRNEDKPWKNDMWLPKALANVYPYAAIPSNWFDTCSKYANGDSEHTLYLGLEMERLIRERGYWKIYEHRLNLPRIACEMELYGVTAIGKYTDYTIDEYQRYTAEGSAELKSIASEYSYDLELAEGASINDNMRDFFYGSIKQSCPSCNYVKRIKHWTGEVIKDEVCPKCIKRKRKPARHRLNVAKQDNLKLPIIYNEKSGGASLDKNAMQDYLTTLDGTPKDFVKILTDKRKHDTDLSYMEAYRRFWVPVKGSPDYYRIHASLNPFATDHLRWASNSPNLQNVGKQEDDCDECDGEGCVWCSYTGKTRVSVRNCFGPLPDREWWSMDFQNIELRVPAYESGEEAMIELFEKPNEPPYFGSYHLLNASIIYPDEFWPIADKKGLFKDRYKSNLYQYDKNGGFAIQYGCGEKKADATFRRKGAFRLLKQKLPKVAALNYRYVSMAEKTGFVETIPDRTVDPAKGYPILASRTDNGRVLSTTPFNYHVSGTACWCKNKALIRCSEQLETWRQEEGFDGHIALEIHDEIVFDFPRGDGPDMNKSRALILKGLMEKSGDDIGIPTPCSIEYHKTTWAKGVAI